MLGDGPIFETEDEAQEIGDCEAPFSGLGSWGSRLVFVLGFRGFVLWVWVFFRVEEL